MIIRVTISPANSSLWYLGYCWVRGSVPSVIKKMSVFRIVGTERRMQSTSSESSIFPPKKSDLMSCVAKNLTNPGFQAKTSKCYPPTGDLQQEYTANAEM